MRQQLAREWVVDGNATNNEERWHGIESFFGVTGTVGITDGDQNSSADAADLAGWPDDSYAAYNTDLGEYGGEQRSGDYWPEGTADAEFDWWSPLIVNYTSTSFNGTNANWFDQGEEAMRYGMIHSGRNDGEYESTTQIFLDRSLYFQFKQKQASTKERINVDGSASTGLRSLGFGNVTMLDGVEVTFDNAVPANVGYGMNPMNCKLCNMFASLLETEGPEWDIDDGAFKALVKNRSNLRFKSPRNFFKLANLA
jgi:hypothetical protein